MSSGECSLRVKRRRASRCEKGRLFRDALTYSKGIFIFTRFCYQKKDKMVGKNEPCRSSHVAFTH